MNARRRLPGFFAALLAGALMACGNFGDPVVETPVQAPRIAYDTSMTFFAGSLDARPVTSTGGPVTAWTIVPALPAGLSLHAVTGDVSGAPETASPPTRYVVTAHGPGGTGSASFTLGVQEIARQDGAAKPEIRYAAPFYDTVGRAVSHFAISTGGPVAVYTVHPALPPGLALDASTGRISGAPAAARAETYYSVVASGPGGRDTAVVRLAVGATFAPPRIAYAAFVIDTTGVAARHAPTSTGGPVASYALLPPDVQSWPDRSGIPPGLTLDSVTGVISGTPSYPLPFFKPSLTVLDNVIWDETYSIIARGPGGKDTASIRIQVLGQGVVPEPVPSTEIDLRLPIDALGFPLSRLVVRLQSNATVPDVLNDTILANTQGFQAQTQTGQYVMKTYVVKPLRHWTVTATLYRENGTPVRTGTGTALNMLVGERRVVIVPLYDGTVIDNPPLVNPLPKR